mmetsp:Transcript_27072/g.90597  ORF Transcript_27072/g.90597 Transcript_27072/m.90597 type:complete len:127 (+) Transcript_27072:225-605(+)
MRRPRFGGERALSGRAGPCLRRYPTLYAPDTHPNAKEFNSAQRAHQNTLETWAPVMCLMLASGVRAPRVAAAFGATWVAGRAIYGAGYAMKGPKGRVVGFAVATLGGQFPLMFLTAYQGAKMAGLM